MTSNDPMPWGKYKGTPICDVPASYKEWLLGQPGFAEKNPAMAKLFDEGDSDELSTLIERKNIDDGAALLAPMCDEFKAFWKTQYGERMRKQGEVQYLSFLRVAITTWRAARPGERITVPVAKTMLPPPLSHIPAPNFKTLPKKPALPSVLEADLGNPPKAGDEDDVNDPENNKEAEDEARQRALGLEKDGTPLF